MTSDDFPKVSGLQLTALDLHALGAVIAQWAVAEVMIRKHVYSLTLMATAPELKGQRVPPGFDRMQEAWIELLRDVCKGHDKYIKAGVALAGAAKNLCADRDAAAHWPASRSGMDMSRPADFRKVNIKSGKKETKSFSPEDLLKLSERIYQLACDVTFFDYAYFCDLFPSQCKWHGPKPQGAILDSRPIPTIQKPFHQQRSFRE